MIFGLPSVTARPAPNSRQADPSARAAAPPRRPARATSSRRARAGRRRPPTSATVKASWKLCASTARPKTAQASQTASPTHIAARNGSTERGPRDSTRATRAAIDGPRRPAPARARRGMRGGAERLLADTFALYLKTKNFHWHVSGPHFRDYHLLLDEQAAQLFAATDDMAERVRKVGGTTLRSIGHVGRLQRRARQRRRLRDARGHAGRAARRQPADGRAPARGARALRRGRRRGDREPDRELDRRGRAAGLVPVRGDAPS